MTLLTAHEDEVGSIEIAIETGKGLLVAALRAAGRTLFPINPRVVARYRERYGQDVRRRARQASGAARFGRRLLLRSWLQRTGGDLYRALLHRLGADRSLAN